MLFKEQLAEIERIENGWIVKAGLTAKTVIDYTREQLKGATVTLKLFGFVVGELSFTSPEVQRAQPNK